LMLIFLKTSALIEQFYSSAIGELKIKTIGTL
jgi:hypothetical protein